MEVLLIVLGANAVMWLLIILGWRHQRAKLTKSLTDDLAFTGEHLLLGPQNGYYAMTKGRVSVRSMGVMALTTKRLIFRVMFGKGFDIPMEDVTEITQARWFEGMYRNGREFLILQLRDGGRIGFQMKNHSAWMEEIRRQIAS